jgi:hypothetical protein
MIQKHKFFWKRDQIKKQKGVGISEILQKTTKCFFALAGTGNAKKMALINPPKKSAFLIINMMEDEC